MNDRDIYDAITDLDDGMLGEANEVYKSWRGRFRFRLLWTVLLVGVFLFIGLSGALGKVQGGSLLASAYALTQPEYPEDTLRGEWDYNDSLKDFYTESIGQILSGAEGENKVYSPLNVYMALSMLAETTGGESRQQILDLLGHDDIAALRKQAHTIWQANYCQDDHTKSVLASSLWMNEEIEFDAHTLNILAEAYYASSYQGEMGSKRFTKAFQSWLNAQTGNLLKEQASSLELPSDTVMALATTVYYKVKWSEEFDPEDTKPGTFRAANGDVERPFMHQQLMDLYFEGENFSAVRQAAADAGQSSMWYILPDEGVTVDDLLAEAQVMEFIADPEHAVENSERYLIDLSVPRFDVTSSHELSEDMKALGVVDVFDAGAADFSALTDSEPVWLSTLQHDVRVTADEEGVEAASYTVGIMLGGSGPDKRVEFVLDRPFLFLITGLDGQPLFAGVVNQP